MKAMTTLTAEQIEKFRTFLLSESDDETKPYADQLCTLALRGLATMPRPIEEAPKDGSEILAFADDPNLAGRRYSGVAQWAEADPAFSTTVSGWFWPFAIRPTHFIPLSALESPKP